MIHSGRQVLSSTDDLTVRRMSHQASLWGTLQSCLASVLVSRILQRRSGFPVLAHAVRAHVLVEVGMGSPPH